MKDLEKRLERSKKLQSGEEKFTLDQTGEEGVLQIGALLGLGDMLTYPTQDKSPTIDNTKEYLKDYRRGNVEW